MSTASGGNDGAKGPGQSRQRLPPEAPQILEMAIKNNLSEIDLVTGRFDAFSEEHGIPKGICRKMKLVFDELLNNTISYAYRDDGDHEIRIRVELVQDRLTVTITDDGVPFNPLAENTPDTALSMEEREIGGLGIHIVRSVTDEVSYHHAMDKNIVTLVKNLKT